MKKVNLLSMLAIMVALLAGISLSSCSDDDKDKDYAKEVVGTYAGTFAFSEKATPVTGNVIIEKISNERVRVRIVDLVMLSASTVLNINMPDVEVDKEGSYYELDETTRTLNVAENMQNVIVTLGGMVTGNALSMRVLIGPSMTLDFTGTKTTGGGDDKVDPSTIATTNLIAYFPFDGNGNDMVGGLTPAQSPNITFPTGRRGTGFQGAESGFLLYELPAASKLKTLKAFSFSLWTRLIPTVDGGPEPMIFQMDGNTDWIWGNLFLLQHRNGVEADTSMLDCYFWKDNAAEWKGQRASNLPVVSFNRWVHLTCTYDNATSKFHFYVNGTLFMNTDGTEYGGTNRWQAEGETLPLGDLNFNTPETLAIGAWVARAKGTDLQTDDWAGYFTGMIDEFRIYDRSLTATEVNSLYRAEVSQVNQ